MQMQLTEVWCEPIGQDSGSQPVVCVLLGVCGGKHQKTGVKIKTETKLLNVGLQRETFM
jgi:hypothetical protein